MINVIFYTYTATVDTCAASVDTSVSDTDCHGVIGGLSIGGSAVSSLSYFQTISNVPGDSTVYASGGLLDLGGDVDMSVAAGYSDGTLIFVAVFPILASSFSLRLFPFPPSSLIDYSVRNHLQSSTPCLV